jgi:excisionase family DNA binding protein
MEPVRQISDGDHLEPRVGRSVSIEQAAQLLGVSRRTVYNRIRDGKLQTIRTLGGSQRVLMTSLDEIRRPAIPLMAGPVLGPARP